MCQKCIKKCVLSHFWYILYQNVSSRCFIFPTKVWQKCVKSNSFVRFLSHFCNEFCQILNTFLILTDLCYNFGDFLTHFCHNLDFSKFLSVFWQFYVKFLTFVTILSHFWGFLLHFCYIFEIAGPTLSMSTPIFVNTLQIKVTYLL